MVVVASSPNAADAAARQRATVLRESITISHSKWRRLEYTWEVSFQTISQGLAQSLFAAVCLRYDYIHSAKAIMETAKPMNGMCFFACENPLSDHWQLGSAPVAVGQMMLLGWSQDNAHDGGIPMLVQELVVRALTSSYRMTFPVSGKVHTTSQSVRRSLQRLAPTGVGGGAICLPIQASNRSVAVHLGYRRGDAGFR